MAVIEADTGRGGLEEVARCQPDVIVLDLGLPDLGGLEVLKQLREWSQRAGARPYGARGRGRQGRGP